MFFNSFQQLFLYIPGIIIFLVGSGQARDFITTHRKGRCLDAKVITSQHVIKKDNQGRETFNFYHITVEFKNPENNHTERQALKSPTDFSADQDVKLIKNGEQYIIMDTINESLFNPFVSMILGALLIVLALEQNQGKELPAMICLSACLLIIGGVMVWNFVSLKKRDLRPIPAEVVEVYTRQISKETKILRGNKYTYYPIVRYELDGHENRRRCNINSSQESAFKVGEALTLYYDPKKHTVIERHPQLNILIIGVVVLAAGILATASLLTQFIS